MQRMKLTYGYADSGRARLLPSSAGIADLGSGRHPFWPDFSVPSGGRGNQRRNPHPERLGRSLALPPSAWIRLICNQAIEPGLTLTPRRREGGGTPSWADHLAVSMQAKDHPINRSDIERQSRNPRVARRSRRERRTGPGLFCLRFLRGLRATRFAENLRRTRRSWEIALRRTRRGNSCCQSLRASRLCGFLGGFNCMVTT